MITITRHEISPLMTAAILAFPQSKDRAVKGSELLATGKVQRLADAGGADRWLVYGSGSEPYNVSLANDSCDCPDRAATCKHKHACRFALALGVAAPVEVMESGRAEERKSGTEDATLWSVDENPDAILDAEVAGKVAELTAAGVDTNAEILVIGDWVWVVGDADADLMDSLGVKWHAKRGVHYWRPVWAAMDPEGFNEKKDLMGLAEKYGVQRHIPRRSQRVEKSAVELALLLVPKMQRDDDGELWA